MGIWNPCLSGRTEQQRSTGPTCGRRLRMIEISQTVDSNGLGGESDATRKKLTTLNILGATPSLESDQFLPDFLASKPFTKEAHPRRNQSDQPPLEQRVKPMTRATLCTEAHAPAHQVVVEWISKWSGHLGYCSGNVGCGCCLDIYHVDAPDEALAELPRNVFALSDWTELSVS
jgi:hypothetical protein